MSKLISLFPISDIYSLNLTKNMFGLWSVRDLIRDVQLQGAKYSNKLVTISLVIFFFCLVVALFCRDAEGLQQKMRSETRTEACVCLCGGTEWFMKIDGSLCRAKAAVHQCGECHSVLEDCAYSLTGCLIIFFLFCWCRISKQMCIVMKCTESIQLWWSSDFD